MGILIWAADFPVQYIVPAIFLIIWVFNQVTGRDDPTRKAATEPRRSPDHPRAPRSPGSPGSWGQDGRRSVVIPAERDPRRGPSANDDDMLVIGPNGLDLSSSRGKPGKTAGAARPDSRPARGKEKGRPGRPGRPETRTQSGSGRPVGGTSVPSILDDPVASPTEANPSTAVPLTSVKGLSMSSWREAILLKEILGPPPGLEMLKKRGPNGPRS